MQTVLLRQGPYGLGASECSRARIAAIIMLRGSQEGEASPYALRASGDRPARENKKGVRSGCGAPLPDRVVDEGEKAGDESTTADSSPLPKRKSRFFTSFRMTIKGKADSCQRQVNLDYARNDPPTLKLRRAGPPVPRLRRAGPPVPRLRRAGPPVPRLRRAGPSFRSPQKNTRQARRGGRWCFSEKEPLPGRSGERTGLEDSCGAVRLARILKRRRG